MLSIHRSRLPAEEAQVREALQAYVDALATHRLSVGEPAPWPAFEILRDIVADGGDFVVVDDEPSAADERALKRAAALRALDDARLAAAMADPAAPAAVKAYAAALEG